MAMVTTTVSPGARPSMPSVRLTALLVPATIMMAKIMKAIWGSKITDSDRLLDPGIHVRKKGRFNTNAVGCSMSPSRPTSAAAPLPKCRWRKIPIKTDKPTWKRSFSHIRKPSLDPSRLPAVSFNQSSKPPSKAKNRVVAMAKCTKLSRRSAKSKTESINAPTMRIPPMVGVPDFS